MDIRKYIDENRSLIDKALDRYLPSAKRKPQVIHKVMRYAVFPGGKRIRPLLTLASFEACGGTSGAIMPVACAIELIHTYTLVHDDLPCMDNDDYRRGRLSCHKKFNEALALLAGDALLALGFQLLSESGNAGVSEELSKAIGSFGTIGGQAVDIESKRAKSKEQRVELDYIVSRKTGAIFEASLKVAGIFKGAGNKEINALKNFGKYVGFTFQLVDDLIDNDGYVDIYGHDYVRKMARLFTERAKAQLDIFGKRQDRLSAIADFVLERES